MVENPYKREHPKESLSLELNFRSFLAGEGEAFFAPVPVEDMERFAAIGSPITIPNGAPYSADDLVQIAKAVKQGGGTLTVLGAGDYPADVLQRLENEAPGQVRHA